MKRLIITEAQLKIIKEHIIGVDPINDTNNHEKSLQTVINKQRNIGFFGGATPEEVNNLKKSGLKYIAINKNNAYVFFNDGYEENGNELAAIARRFNGFLPADGKISFNGLHATPEEVYRIGILLGYREDSIKKHILDKFPNYQFY